MARRLTLLVAATLLVAVCIVHAASATAETQSCADAVTTVGATGATGTTGTTGTPSPGHPCWVDVTPYPFGADGNPVDPNSPPPGCNEPSPPRFGPNWSGDFRAGPSTNVPCYLDVTSMAFRAWNRGLAATTYAGDGAGPTAPNAFGVWLYNGSDWYPDPTFPGGTQCPGPTVLWAGKLDYWLVGSPGVPITTLCRFDGVNLSWEPLKLPAATLARLAAGPAQGVTAGACYAWNNCWFFGTQGIIVHWDGQSLVDASSNLGDATIPVIFQAAVGGTDSSGNAFGVALGIGPPDVFSSSGGAYYPTSLAAPAPLQLAAAAATGDVWAAGPIALTLAAERPDAPTPLLRLTDGGGSALCDSGLTGVNWTSLAAFPDGRAIAGTWSDQDGAGLIDAGCGAESATKFIMPDPCFADQATAPLLPATPRGAGDASAGRMTATAAPAANVAWAATSQGLINASVASGCSNDGSTRPHLYYFTDGETPNAPSADDNEPRSDLLTPAPPVFVPAPPSFTPIPQTTPPPVKPKTKVIKVKPAIYDVTSKVPKLSHAAAARGLVTLYIDFKVRRTVTVGVDALHGPVVVARSGLHRFHPGNGRLTLHLNRKHWPNHLTFVFPKKHAADDA